MAKVTLPYTIVNGAANDGVPVQGNFNALLAGINIIDTEQLNGPIVGLANLMSTVKVIESITNTDLGINYTETVSETIFLTQNVTLSAQRYCLFLVNALIFMNKDPAGDAEVYVNLYDGATKLVTEFLTLYVSATGGEYPFAYHIYKQITSGAHTFYLKSNIAAATSGYIFCGTATKLTTIVFAF